MEKTGLLKRACITLVVCTAAVIAAPAQTFTTLYSFDSTDGRNPTGLIQGTDGNFYGMTFHGGSSYCEDGCGTIFKVTPGGTLTTLHTFCQTDCADGRNPSPSAWLIQATDGNFYGTTEYGGPNGYGTVFRITPGGTLTTLYSFCAPSSCPDGSTPTAGLIQATDGNFYGTTGFGGAYGNIPGHGTIFRITPEGMLTRLYSFCAQTGCPDGFSPSGLIQGTDGNFYGTTLAGGATLGTIFRITPEGTLTTLHTFCQTDCADGYQPSAGLIQAIDGNFYGTTKHAGAHGGGTVFKITPGGTLTTLYGLCAQKGCADGSSPGAALIQATDGNFYGTTEYGGANNCANGCGTLFEITPTGTLGTLHSFDNTYGRWPAAGLIQATDGSFYGITGYGGANNCEDGCGTIFHLAVAPPAVTLTPTSLSFGNQALNETSSARTVILQNSGSIGSALLIMNDVTIDGSGFAISANTCGALSMGKKCKVSVNFTPTALGKVTGTLTLNDNASDSPQTVPLSGTGVGPATVTPITYGYGPWVVNTISTAKTFTLANNRSVALTSIAISTTGDFALSATTCTTTLAAKSKCSISVTFTPAALGKRTGVLSVSDSASNSPQTAALAGTGVLPATLTPATAFYALQAVGTTSLPKTFTLANNQTVSLIGIAIAPTGDFAVSATTCTTTLAAKSKCTISVTFTPTAVGTRTGKLIVNDSAINSPRTATLKGTGK